MRVDGTTVNLSSAPQWLPGEGRALLLIALVGAVLYFSFFNHDFSVDGLRYAAQVEQGGPLLHPNHLLSNTLFWLVWRVVREFSDVRSIWVMQALNALLGIATALFLARALALRAGVAGACAAAGLYLVGFAAWNFAQESEVYVLPACLVSVSFALLWRSERIGWSRLIALTLLAVVAVLCLQQYVLWYPALLALLWQHDLGNQRRAKCLLVAVVVPLACLVTYLVVAWCQGAGVESQQWLYWFLGYASDGSREGGYWPLSLSRRALAMFAGLCNMVISYDAVTSPYTMLAAMIVGTAMLVLAWHCFRCAIALPAAARARLRALGGFALLNLAFGAWWAAGDIEFLVPVWLALCAIVGTAAGGSWRGVAAVAVLVALLNLVVTFAPQRDWPDRYVRVAALARAGQLASGDVLISEELNTIGYLDYFGGMRLQFQPGAVSTLIFPQANLATQRAYIEQALRQGRRVYTMERTMHDRLYSIAALWARGRQFEQGDGVDGALATLYSGLTVTPSGVEGVEQVTLAPP